MLQVCIYILDQKVATRVVNNVTLYVTSAASWSWYYRDRFV